MGLQPIDLQTMYSQLSNVARDAASATQAQLSESMHQVDIVKRNMEEAQKVQNTQENSSAAQINKDGKNSGYSGNSEKSRKNTDSENNEDSDSQTKSKNPLEPYLGQHIDITR